MLQQRGLELQQMSDMQPCSKVLMQGRLFSHGETSLLCTLEPHPLKLQVHTCKLCQRNYAHILHVRWHLGFCCMLRPHPVKCMTSQCTTVQRYISWLCSQMQQSNTWQHPTGMLGVVSGATDLNLSTHRGQCNNFDSTRTHMWSCSLTI